MDGLDLADRPVFCIYPDLRRVDGNLGKIQPGWRSAARCIRIGHHSRRPTVHQSARQCIYLPWMALVFFHSAVWRSGFVDHLVGVRVLARLKSARSEFGQLNLDGQ